MLHKCVQFSFNTNKISVKLNPKYDEMVKILIYATVLFFGLYFLYFMSGEHTVPII
jgi:hypothetical protein